MSGGPIKRRKNYKSGTELHDQDTYDEDRIDVEVICVTTKSVVRTVNQRTKGEEPIISGEGVRERGSYVCCQLQKQSN